MSRARFALASAAALTVPAILTACSPETSNTAQASSSAPRSSAAAPAALSVTSVGSLRQVVTAADGETLHRFDEDTTNPSSSSGNGYGGH